MSDRTTYYETLRRRAGALQHDIDEGIQALLRVEQRLQDVAQADFGEPGELSPTDHADLKTCLTQALFYLREAEHLTHNHIHELDTQLGALGLDPLTVTRQAAGP